MRDQRHWNGFDQRLRHKGLSVITPDLPGNGERVAEISPLNIADYTAAIWQQLDATCAEHEPIYLLGLSMGGMLALEMARQRPWQIRHVFVLNSSAANLSLWYQRFNPFNVVKAFCLRTRAKGLHPLESSIVRLTSHRHHQDCGLIARWSAFRRESCPSLRNAMRQLWAAFRYQCPLVLAVPVSVLCGDRDALVSIESSRALARHFQCDLIILAYCGHDMAIDAPAKLADYLLKNVNLAKPRVAFDANATTAKSLCFDLLEEETVLSEAAFSAWDQKALSTGESE
jgi:pimeloyl-ACP methyl ester carboxylesterase